MIKIATIQSTLALQDSMSPVLTSITKALSSTLKAMRSIKDIELGVEFAHAATDIKLAERALEEMTKGIQDMGDKDPFPKVKYSILEANAALDIFNKGLNLVRSGMSWVKEFTGLSDIQNQVETSLAVVMSNNGTTYNEYKNLLSDMAETEARTTISGTAMTAGMAEIATYMSDPEALKALMPTMEDFMIGMNAGDPRVAESQATQYMTALGKALQGQMGGLTLKGFVPTDTQKEILELGTDMEKVAVLTEIIGADWGGIAESVAQTDLGQIVQMENSIGNLKTAIGDGLYPYLLQFQTLLSNGISPALEFVANNINTIIPIVVGLTAGIMALGVGMGIQTAVTWLSVAANRALIVTMLSNPFLWIAIIIGVLIGVIYQWIQAVGGIDIAWAIAVDNILLGCDILKLGFFMGVYGIMDLFDSLNLGVLKVGVGIQNIMGNTAANVLNELQDLVNGAIGIINDFIGTINKIPGVNIDTIQKVTFGATTLAENEANKQARNAEFKSKEYAVQQNSASRHDRLTEMAQNAHINTANRQQNISNMQVQKASKEKSLTESIFDGAVNIQNGIPNDLITNGSGGKALKTNNTEPFITDEDIKMLTDIATRDYQLNYRQITPEITMTFGDIRETADADKIADIISERLVEVARGNLEVAD